MTKVVGSFAPAITMGTLPDYQNAEIAQKRTVVFSEDNKAGKFFINGEEFNGKTMYTPKLGTFEEWTIKNVTGEDHPFHIHGNRFQVVDVGGESVPEGQGWKDTFDIPPRTTVTLVSALDNPGEWMYHCHILEHGDAGMAGMMTVE